MVKGPIKQSQVALLCIVLNPSHPWPIFIGCSGCKNSNFSLEIEEALKAAGAQGGREGETNRAKMDNE